MKEKREIGEKMEEREEGKDTSGRGKRGEGKEEDIKREKRKNIERR